LAVGLSKHFYNLNKYSLSDSELLGFEGKYNIDDFRYISKKFEGLTKDSMDSVISEWETKPFIFELILGGSFNDGAFGCYLDVCTIVLKSTPVVPAETYKPVITLPKNENVKEDNKNIYEEIKGLLSKDSEKYQTNPKTVKLSLIGDFIVYRGVNDYLAGLDRSISYYYTPPTSKDFILRDLDNKVQKDYLNLLVDKIKAKSDDPDQQARTAISMVQAIPYDWDAFNSGNVDGRYPYEVLYDIKGVCMEKADLLAFLLRELGYGVAIFEYNAENHRAVGIQCEKGNYNTQYCFIEATNSYPIGQIPEGYVGGADIRNANPEVVVISGGRTYLLRLASN